MQKSSHTTLCYYGSDIFFKKISLKKKDQFLRDYETPEVLTSVCSVVEYNELIFKHAHFQKDFSLLHNNIRSIAKNFNKLSVFLSILDIHYDCIVLTETWNVGDLGFFEIHGYNKIYNRGGFNKMMV